jgi:hypothetical protein
LLLLAVWITIRSSKTGWNAHPPPFVWNGKRRLRRQRVRDTQLHPLGGSGAVTPRLIDRLNQWQRSCQLIHYQFLIDERIISECSKTYVLIEP